MKPIRKGYRNRTWQLEALRAGHGMWEPVGSGSLLKTINVLVHMAHLSECAVPPIRLDPQRLRNLKTGEIITYVVGEKLYFTPPTWFA